MIITKATWEERNLGVSCTELTLEQTDDINTVMNTLASHESEYTVIKVPPGLIEPLFYLQTQGYKFIETITTCSHNGDRLQLNKLQQRLLNDINYQRMSESDVNFLFCELDKGLFKTDRIALDPHFTIEQANNRYKNWISDELTRGSLLYKLHNDFNSIGFFGVKKIHPKTYHSFIGGIYSDFLTSGLGFFVNYFQIVEVKKLGATNVISPFSSNNRGAAAVHFSMGYTLKSQHHVLVKHKTERPAKKS